MQHSTQQGLKSLCFQTASVASSLSYPHLSLKGSEYKHLFTDNVKLSQCNTSCWCSEQAESPSPLFTPAQHPLRGHPVLREQDWWSSIKIGFQQDTGYCGILCLNGTWLTHQVQNRAIQSSESRWRPDQVRQGEPLKKVLPNSHQHTPEGLRLWTIVSLHSRRITRLIFFSHSASQKMPPSSSHEDMNKR